MTNNIQAPSPVPAARYAYSVWLAAGRGTLAASGIPFAGDWIGRVNARPSRLA